MFMTVKIIVKIVIVLFPFHVIFSKPKEKGLDKSNYRQSLPKLSINLFIWHI